MSTIPQTPDELAAWHNFGTEHTGGGCTAYSKDIEGQQGQQLFALVTEIDEPSAPSRIDTVCVLSIHDRASENAEPLVCFECPSLEFAFKLADMARA